MKGLKPFGVRSAERGALKVQIWTVIVAALQRRYAVRSCALLPQRVATHGKKKRRMTAWTQADAQSIRRIHWHMRSRCHTTSAWLCEFLKNILSHRDQRSALLCSFTAFLAPWLLPSSSLAFIGSWWTASVYKSMMSEEEIRLRPTIGAELPPESPHRAARAPLSPRANVNTDGPKAPETPTPGHGRYTNAANCRELRSFTGAPDS